MQAIRLHDHTGLSGVRVEEVDRPEPGPGEVRLRVHAAGVDPVDWKIADDDLQQMLGHTRGPV